MRKFIDLSGRIFCHLTILHRIQNKDRHKVYWLCQCDCGEKIILQTARLVNGSYTSCGCFEHEKEFKKNLSSLNRRSKKHNARIGDMPVTLQMIRELFAEYNHTCAYCDAPATSIDHVVPLSKGGLHIIENLVPACIYCNSSKGAKLLSEWVKK